MVFCLNPGLRELDARYNDLKEPAKSFYESGLPKFLEFLRDEEERLRLEEIERMKPVGIEVRPTRCHLCLGVLASELLRRGQSDNAKRRDASNQPSSGMTELAAYNARRLSHMVALTHT